MRWAREQALPAINRLAGADKFDDAYRLALQAESYIPKDPLLAEQFRVISRPAVIESAPSGAQVFYRPYGQTGEPWRSLGTFARWAGKSLPTIFHWSRAADQRLSGDVVPASNFGGKGPLPAGRNGGGITRAGTIDMAGNVKEWCWNNAGAKRYILGGAWNEPAYMFTDADAQSPLARSPTFGFRCIRTDRAEDLSAGVAGGVHFRRAICGPYHRSAMPSSGHGRASTRSITTISMPPWMPWTTPRRNGAWRR